MHVRTNLNGIWTLQYGPEGEGAPTHPGELGASSLRTVPATVPGNVELDLLAADTGELTAPLERGNNVYGALALEGHCWWYTRAFDGCSVPEGWTAELVFEGLDCLATVWLNGAEIGLADNALIPHRFDVTHRLRAGAGNELAVRLASAVRAGRARTPAPCEWAGETNWESLALRKPPHAYGWDILPRLVSAGIWRDVYVELRPPVHLRSVYWATRAIDLGQRTADVALDWDVEAEGAPVADLRLRFALRREGRDAVRVEKPLLGTHGRELLRVESADLWWPRGYGAPALYEASVELLNASGEVLDERRERIGLRTIELLCRPLSPGGEVPERSEGGEGGLADPHACEFAAHRSARPPSSVAARHLLPQGRRVRTPLPSGRGPERSEGVRGPSADPYGGEPANPCAFLFRVNGQLIYGRGTNWVPLDALHSRDGQHLRDTFAMLVDLNCNMVRCWGGNVYESDAFFDLCDEYGILVWQDFAMACGCYPQDDAFAAALAREAAALIPRLRNHPALALWAGNNENDLAYGWGGLPLDPNDDRISRTVLPAAVRQLDPYRPYLPSSPYVSPEVHRSGDLNRCPEQHLWGPRDDYKGPFYTQSPAAFVSEIGYHGCPDRRSLQAMMDPDHLWPWQGDEQWLTHAVRSVPGDTRFHYRIPLMAKQTAVLFGTVPDTLDDFILASQLSQAEALKFFIERWRIRKGRTSGLLWWNLRDGWPVISDAVVDYYHRRKLAYEYVRRVQTDVCVMCDEPAAGRSPVVVANDTLRDAPGSVRITDADSAALLLHAPFIAAANAATVVGEVPASDRPRLWLLEWSLDGCETAYRSHYLSGPRPVTLETYKQWLPLLKLPR